ncbi:uncharacterized protein V6R79_004844 [Siganus canaliculatus]
MIYGPLFVRRRTTTPPASGRTLPAIYQTPDPEDQTLWTRPCGPDPVDRTLWTRPCGPDPVDQTLTESLRLGVFVSLLLAERFEVTKTKQENIQRINFHIQEENDKKTESSLIRCFLDSEKTSDVTSPYLVSDVTGHPDIPLFITPERSIQEPFERELPLLLYTFNLDAMRAMLEPQQVT